MSSWKATWRAHGTKILGSVQAVIPSILSIKDLIPEWQVKYWMLAQVLLGLGTVVRGLTNTRANAAVIAQDPPP